MLIKILYLWGDEGEEKKIVERKYTDNSDNYTSFITSNRVKRSSQYALESSVEAVRYVYFEQIDNILYTDKSIYLILQSENQPHEVLKFIKSKKSPLVSFEQLSLKI